MPASFIRPSRSPVRFVRRRSSHVVFVSCRSCWHTLAQWGTGCASGAVKRILLRGVALCAKRHNNMLEPPSIVGGFSPCRYSRAGCLPGALGGRYGGIVPRQSAASQRSNNLSSRQASAFIRVHSSRHNKAELDQWFPTARTASDSPLCGARHPRRLNTLVYTSDLLRGLEPYGRSGAAPWAIVALPDRDGHHQT